MIERRFAGVGYCPTCREEVGGEIVVAVNASEYEGELYALENLEQIWLPTVCSCMELTVAERAARVETLERLRSLGVY